ALRVGARPVGSGTWVEFAGEILPMSAPRFVHLRVHSEYSVSDSIVRLESLIGAALADEQPAVAVTDLANLFGWVKFYKAARDRRANPMRRGDPAVSRRPA